MKKVEDQSEEKELKDDTIVTLQGSIGYELTLRPDGYDTKLQINTENNFVAMVMTRDQITAIIKRNALPTLTAKDKLKPEILKKYLDCRNLLDELCNGVATHLIRQGKNGAYKPEIIMPDKKKIITLDKSFGK